MAATADEHGVPLLMCLDETQSYVVYHSGHRSTPGSWAAIEADFPQLPGTKKSAINEKANYSNEGYPVQGESLLLSAFDKHSYEV